MYGKFLYFPLNFVVNLNLFLKIVKIKIIIQRKNAFYNQFNRAGIQANSKIIFLYILIKHYLRNKSYCKTQNSGLRSKEEKPRDPINQPNKPDATRKRVYCRLHKQVTLISWEAEHPEQQIG